MRYEVKVDDKQLTFGSLAELRALYAQGFVAADDLVRPEGSERWIRAGQMPVLRAAQSRTSVGARAAGLLTVSLLFSAVVGAWVFHYKEAALVGLVLLAAATPFVVYRRKR
ncbi:MAG TPA: DUF4339 domain-containing protein [Myxococcales bacterium]|nr:DUF4339 domain-containing protein [Myxococcales bacterium]